MARFDGKKVLVTGGSSGIGLATARRIADEGGKVAITGTTEKHLNEAREQIPDVLAFENDASDPAEAEALGKHIGDEFGTLDGLFLNAGFGKFFPLSETEPSAFDDQFHVNVRGPLLHAKHLFPLMSEGGSVVITSSVAHMLGQPEGAIYGATKGAVRAMARSFARGQAGQNIRVNTIAPGPIETNFFEGMGLSDQEIEEFSKQIKQQVPLARFGSSDEVAAVACFLLSDDASYVTGAEYLVDGGMTMA